MPVTGSCPLCLIALLLSQYMLILLFMTPSSRNFVNVTFTAITSDWNTVVVVPKTMFP